jgi:hypothetical protein
MPQLPEKIDVLRLQTNTAPLYLAEKLNEIIDYLGELEGGK